MKRKTCIFKNIVMLLMTVGLVTAFVSCSNKDNDEVGPLRQELQALKADMEAKFIKKADLDISNIQTRLNAAEEKIKALDKGNVSLSEEEVEKLKNEILTDVVTLEAYEKFKKRVLGSIEDSEDIKSLKALTTDFNGIEGRVAVLEALLDIKADSNSVFSRNPQAKKYISGVLQKLNEDVANNVKIIKEFKETIGANNDNFKVKLDEFLTKKLNINIPELTGRLSSLILVPEYVADNGGALPILNFSPIRTEKCGDIVPAVMVRYMVNPSNAKEDQIDKANLKFYYNDPKAAKSNNTVDQKAEFVSLVDGVLTVKATLNTAKLWASKVNPERRIDQLMLQVPLKDGNVINSDWAKVTFKPELPAIVKKPKKQATDAWRLYELKPFVNLASKEASKVEESVKEGVIIGDATKDYTVVDMVYDQDLDLMEHVKAMYRYFNQTGLQADLDLQAYGLHFDFDLKNGVTGQDIVYKLGQNKTDQQQFIKLEGNNKSIVSTKVYSKNGNRAAINRTPIVHVMLKTKSGCVAKEGYIKLNIIDKVLPPIIYKNKKDLVAKCGTHVVDTIRTKKMNEDFYHVVNMTKTEFHKNYKFAQVPLNPSDKTNVGTIRELPDNGTDESYNLVYELTEDEVWNNIGETVWAEATYTFGTSVFKVKFETKIIREKVDLKLVIGNYWYDGDTKHESLTTGKYNAVTSNVAIPAAGATNPALCTWDNNINDVFNTGSDKLLDLSAQNYPGYTYRYEFDTRQKDVSGVRFVVKSSDAAAGKVNDLLYGVKGATRELVAKIKPAVANVGNNIEYQQTDLAKWLLNEGPENMRAKVVLVVLNTCHRQVDVEIDKVEERDRFDVIFVRPVNVKPESPNSFYDVVGAGNPGSYIDMKEIADLSDWRNYVTHTEEYAFSKYPNFYDYYDVVNIKADIAHIKTENLAGVSPKLPSTLNIAQTANGETFGPKTYRYGRLTYDNNGHNFNTDFTLIVPVTISYKWGDVKTTIRVKVNSTGTPKP